MSVACLIVMAVSVETKLEWNSLRLFGVKNGNEGVEPCTPKAMSGSSREERQGAYEKAAETFADKMYRIWCQLVQCLDKKYACS